MCLFILPVKFKYLLTVSHKIYILKQKTFIEKKSISHRKENENFEKKSIRKAFKKIVQYYCYYHWCGLIPEPFYYLTKKTDLQIEILGKTHRFFVLLRNIKEKKLRRSYQMNMNHYLYQKIIILQQAYFHSICIF